MGGPRIYRAPGGVPSKPVPAPVGDTATFGPGTNTALAIRFAAANGTAAEDIARQIHGWCATFAPHGEAKVPALRYMHDPTKLVDLICPQATSAFRAAVIETLRRGPT